MWRKEAHRKFRKMRFSWIITFIVLVFLLGAVIPSSAQEKLTVAMLQSPTQTPVWVVLDSGFFKDHGLEVVPVQFNGGTQTIMALMSGDVQNSHGLFVG